MTQVHAVQSRRPLHPRHPPTTSVLRQTTGGRPPSEGRSRARSWPHMIKPILILAFTLAVASPAAAPAATMSINYEDRDLPHGEFRAAAGESNDVRLWLRSFMQPDGDLRPRLVVQDLGATLNAGAGCVSVDSHTAECGDYDGGDYFHETWLRLGDDDD